MILFSIYPRYFYVVLLIIGISKPLYSQISMFDGHGTTIVCILRNDTIWIGADGKKYNIKGVKFPPQCKIINSGRFVFAHGGLLDNPVFHFNVDSIYIRSFNSNKIGTLQSLITGFQTRLFPILKKMSLTEIRAGAGRYKKGDTIDKLTIGVFFAYFQNNIPKIQCITYVPRIINLSNFYHANVIIEIYTDSISSVIGRFNYILGGIKEEIDNIVVNYKYSHIPQAINELIGLEAKTYPQWVDTNISIIRLAKGKIDWIQKNQSCK